VNILETIAKLTVIPAQAGIQIVYPIDFLGLELYELDSRLRGNDGFVGRGHFFTTSQRD